MGKPTKTHEIYTAIAAEIAHGRLAPGTPLDETTIAQTYGASRTPVREAIRQLEAAGLVEARPHRGALVASIAEQQLDEMFAVMAELEALCARWASFAMTLAERRALQDIHDAAALCVRSGDRLGYIANNDRFHEAIYMGAHNGYLGDLTRTIRRRVAPFRHAQFNDLQRLALSQAEHHRVLQAIQRADGATAYDEMRAHISVVRSAVERIGGQAMLEMPDYAPLERD